MLGSPHGEAEMNLRSIPNPRYCAAALALKGFSGSSVTRRLYRYLSNRVSAKRHSRVSARHIASGTRLWELVALYSPPSKGVSRYLEIGTGWTCFYGLLFRLNFDGHLTLFDVQDCRQMDALKTRFGTVADLLPMGLPDRFAGEAEGYRRRASAIAGTSSFAELCQRMDLEYVVEPGGLTGVFPDNAFDVVFSWNVLEHVPRRQFFALPQEILRILAPGGITVHRIDFTDHLTTQYAPTASLKEYLRYSESAWKACFDNQLQHMNRLQASQVSSAFTESGFELVHDDREVSADLAESVVLSPLWGRIREDDLVCTGATMVFRKPVVASNVPGTNRVA